MICALVTMLLHQYGLLKISNWNKNIKHPYSFLGSICFAFVILYTVNVAGETLVLDQDFPSIKQGFLQRRISCNRFLDDVGVNRPTCWNGQSN